MHDKPGKRDAKSLVSSVLANTQSASAQPSEDASVPHESVSPSPPDQESIDSEARELVLVYFELEEPTERDVVFDQLIVLDSPVVVEFLLAMMADDEDEYMRSAAALELARRGIAAAQAVLEADLEEPDEMFFFANAVEGLTLLRGPAFYDTLCQIWHDSGHDSEARRYAMLCMESLDPNRTLADFTVFLQKQDNLLSMPDDQIEVASVAFARHQYQPGREALVSLRQRINAETGLDEDSRTDLSEMLQEAIDLIDAAGEAP